MFVSATHGQHLASAMVAGAEDVLVLTLCC